MSSFQVPKSMVNSIQAIYFQRLLDIFGVICTSKNSIFPLVIDNGKISQKINGDSAYVNLDISKKMNQPISIEIVLQKKMIKELKRLEKTDVVIEEESGEYVFRAGRQSVRVEKSYSSGPSPAPELNQDQAIAPKLAIKPAKDLKRYLKKARSIFFILYKGQLEAIKTYDQEAFLIDPLNRDILKSEPDAVYHTDFFPALLDGKSVDITLFRDNNAVWAECSNSDKFDFPVKTITRLEG